MKRRTFLSAAGTVGVVGAVSGTTVVSSVYSSMSTSVLLEDFNPVSKNVYYDFKAEILENTRNLGLDDKIAKRTFLPVQIISQKSKGSIHKIVYKNKSGHFVSLSKNKGVKHISISESF